MAGVRNPEARVVDPLCQHLKDLREDRGLRQQDLAEISGVNAAVICHGETGYNWPTLETLERWAPALGVDLADWGVPPAELAGDYIRGERLDQGLTQGQFADAVQASRFAVIRWETGQSVPSLYYLRQAQEAIADQAARAEAGDAMAM